MALLFAFFNQVLRHSFLSLSKGLLKDLLLEVHLISEIQNLFVRVSSLTQNEYNWSFYICVGKQLVHQSHWADSILLSDHPFYVSCESFDEFLLIDQLDDHKLVEQLEMAFLPKLFRDEVEDRLLSYQLPIFQISPLFLILKDAFYQASELIFEL